MKNVKNYKVILSIRQNKGFVTAICNDDKFRITVEYPVQKATMIYNNMNSVLKIEEFIRVNL